MPLAARQLRARDYENRDYYALELSETTPLDVLTRHFGVELEGPLGELPNHYLFSAPTGPRDIVTDQINRYKKLKKRDSRLEELYGSVLFAQKQKLKWLHKRGGPPPRPQVQEKDIPAGRQNPGKAQLKELMDTLKIGDPMFNQQWHLVRQTLAQLHFQAKF